MKTEKRHSFLDLAYLIGLTLSIVILFPFAILARIGWEYGNLVFKIYDNLKARFDQFERRSA